MLFYCLLGFLCLSVVNAEQPKISNKNQQSHLLHEHSCRLNQGTVCIPTACSSTSCSLFKNATCVADRCGCEARFFKRMALGQNFQDVTKMCSSGNFVMNFINYTTTKENELDDENSAQLLTFFKEFNLLVTEILKDITDYLKAVTQVSPTKANIEKLKVALRTLGSLKQTNNDEADKLEKKFLLPLILGALLKDGENDAESDHLVENPKEISNWKNFKNDVASLKVVLGDHGELNDVVKSGHVVISDKDAQDTLKLALRSAKFYECTNSMHVMDGCGFI